MRTIEQEETLAERRDRLDSEEVRLKVTRLDIEREATSIGARLESVTMLALKLQAQADELQERHERVKSRLDEISDELDLIAEAGN